MHPVLESLRDTDRQWLIDTLYAFNSGNVERFQTLKTAWGQQVSPLGLAVRLGSLCCLTLTLPAFACAESPLETPAYALWSCPLVFVTVAQILLCEFFVLENPGSSAKHSCNNFLRTVKFESLEANNEPQ